MVVKMKWFLAVGVVLLQFPDTDVNVDALRKQIRQVFKLARRGSMKGEPVGTPDAASELTLCTPKVTCLESELPKPSKVASESQRQRNPNKLRVNPGPQQLQDIFNTTSCIPPPYRCPHAGMQFYLYTRTTQAKGELLDTLDNESLHNSRFNPNHPTKVVVHGFGGGRNLSPSTDMRKAYFTKGDYNIIIVDYGSLVKEPCLGQIDWAPRFAGMCIAQMLEYLRKHPTKPFPPERVHTIGYSVGAHILGLVANHLQKGKLGRITGLDPTILFYMGNNRSRDLDHTDALFVDILHTGAGILGQWGPNGHADFYVNGGSSQPGCAHDTIFQTLSCDHTKVTPYFIESINSRAGFWAGPCPSLFSYLIGWCEPKDTEYVLMGEHLTHKARGVFYVTTNAKPPYARGFPGKSRRLRSAPPYPYS